MNYYKKEKDLILEKLNESMEIFETGIKSSIENEERRINNLYSSLKDENSEHNENNEELKLNLENIQKNLLIILYK